MNDQDMLAELKDLAGRDDSASKLRLAATIEQVERRAQQHKSINLHWRSVSLLGRARHAIAPRSDLDRPLALALGEKAEQLLRWADALAVRPTTTLLESLASDLSQAIRVDPRLPDVHWDRAVIAVRYYGDYEDATGHLTQAKELGYAHPMLPHLEAILEARPPLSPEPDTSEVKLRRLLLELAEQARGPNESLLHSNEDQQHCLPDQPPEVRTFGEYVRVARALSQADDFPVEAQLTLLSGARAITSDSSEYVLDLLRRFGEMRAERDAPDTRFLDRATNTHLSILRQFSFDQFNCGRQGDDEAALRRAARASQRALRIVDASPAMVDPDLHADLLLSRGQALYALDQHNVIETIRCYREALHLKREAGNADDEERLTTLFWQQIDSRVAETMITLHMGGFGEAIDVLTACADAADDLDDPTHALAVRATLGSVQRSVGLRDDAEENLLHVVTECSNHETVRSAKFELASVYSETGRAKEAAELQEELIAELKPGVDTKAATLLSNYSQSLLILDRLNEARAALEQSWLRLPENERKRLDNHVPESGARIRVLQAEIESRLGKTDDALERLKQAEVLLERPLGIVGLQYHRTRARVLLAAERTSDAIDSLDHADHLLRFMLTQRPSYPTWESMLREWSSLDVSAVRNLIATGTTASIEKALLRAESAKGRVTAWLEQAATPKGAEQALDPDRQRKALECTYAWLEDAPGCRVLSLFASDEGLAVFFLAAGTEVKAAWIKDFRYDIFLSEHYEPWERLVEAGSAGDENAAARADAKTIELLDQIGRWLEEATPTLREGGGRLVILPHRLFRCLPLLHSRLPGGKRLSELFDEVVVAPTLDHLVRPVRVAETQSTDRVAIADSTPDKPAGELPFARCEALIAAGSNRCLLGPDATSAAIRKAFQQPGMVLLSVHGDFDEEQPFRSKLFTADGALELSELIIEGRVKPSEVLLGACESGRSRRSLSDEPLSFPTLILQGGAHTAVAPAWPVDDFSSFLLTTRVIDLVDEGVSLTRAVSLAATWLRELRPAHVRDRLDSLVVRLNAAGPEGQAAAVEIREPLAESRKWIDSLGPDDQPFASTLDWAPFQVFVAGIGSV